MENDSFGDNLKIINKTGYSDDTKVYLNDVEIKHLKELDFILKPDGLIQVDFKVYCNIETDINFKEKIKWP